MVTDTDNQKEFREIEDGGLLEEGDGELDVMVPGSGSIEYSYRLTPVEEDVQVSGDDLHGSFKHDGEEVSAEEINSLLEDEEIDDQQPLMYTGSKMAFYGLNMAGPTAHEPMLYDPEEDEFSEDGQEISELEDFINEYQDAPTTETVSALLQHLYDDLGVRHSTDVSDERAPGQNQDPEEDAIRALEQGHGLCGELERLFTYTMRETGNAAGRPFDNILRYRKEDGTTVADPEGEYVVGHGFPMVEIGGEDVVVDPSIYMHLRETGMDHEEAAASSVDREEIYYTRNRVSPPEMPGLEAEVDEVRYVPQES